MNTLEKTLSGGGKLIAFIVGGHPTIEKSFEAACDVIESGADVLEIGLPFSDPIADGPTIQKASTKALELGMTPAKYFQLTKKVSSRYDTPIVCLTYYNIILQYGPAKFAKSCALNGVQGVIVPDLPIEEAGEFISYLKKNRVDFIFLVAETTPDDRLKKISKKASGFIYVVALLGTTGARKTLYPNLKKLIARIRRHTKTPLVVGFGISTPQQVADVLSYGADAAIVGSAIVKEVEKQDGKKLRDYVASLKAASQ